MKHWRRVTPGQGNLTESATEKRPPVFGRVRVKRWGKSPPGGWQQRPHGKPRQEQCRIGIARRFVRQGRFSPGDPGWQHEPSGNGRPRGMVA